MSPNAGKLVSFALLFLVCGWLTFNGLRKGRLRSRYGFVITAAERPRSFYASIGLYAVLALIGLAGAVRLSLTLVR